jgi:hypothetical protein
MDDARDASSGHRRLAPYNVEAIYRDMRTARRAAQELRESGTRPERVSLRSRQVTGEDPDRGLEPAVEPATRGRDTRVVQRAGRSALLLSVAGAIVLGLIGLALGWVLFGFPSRGAWITLAVGATMGAVLGLVQGGVARVMEEGRREQGILVGAHVDSADEMKRAAEVLRRYEILRIDYYDSQGRTIEES